MIINYSKVGYEPFLTEFTLNTEASLSNVFAVRLFLKIIVYLTKVGKKSERMNPLKGIDVKLHSHRL